MSRQTEPRKPRDTEQSPVRPTRINPSEETRLARKSGALSSREYIARFSESDKEPIEVIDETTQRARFQQIITLCRRIAKSQTEKASDAQVLGLHRSFMAGRL